MPAAKLLTQEELAEYLGVSVGTIENWRYRKVGPDYIPVEGSIRYRPSAVEKYLDAKTKRCAAA